MAVKFDPFLGTEPMFLRSRSGLRTEPSGLPSGAAMSAPIHNAKHDLFSRLPLELFLCVHNYLSVADSARTTASGRVWCALAHCPEFYSHQMDKVPCLWTLAKVKSSFDDTFNDFYRFLDHAGWNHYQSLNAADKMNVRLQKFLPVRTPENDRLRYQELTTLLGNLKSGICLLMEVTTTTQSIYFGSGFPFASNHQGSFSVCEEPRNVHNYTLSLSLLDKSSKEMALVVRNSVTGQTREKRVNKLFNSQYRPWLYASDLKEGRCFVRFRHAESWYAGERTSRKQNVTDFHLDFSAPIETVLFDLADRLSQDDNADNPQIDRFNISLSRQDQNAIFWELYFMNQAEGDRVVGYGELLFQKQGHERLGLSITNKTRREAVLRYAMRLIAVKFVAPHADAAEVVALFAQLPKPLQDAVYTEVYKLKRPTGTDDVWGYGELAFTGRMGALTNLERSHAIDLFLGQRISVL